MMYNCITTSGLCIEAQPYDTKEYIKPIKCESCGAPRNPRYEQCEYCGTHYVSEYKETEYKYDTESFYQVYGSTRSFKL